mmetsp:Transcript_35055/g.75696  ORF Transcript_35055/g.75696 Transcript_35055/m.75696 type:complete len:153 (-) Transcript_35055:38-496(-)
MASLSNRKIEEHNAGTQSESSSERSNVESSDEFENYPGKSAISSSTSESPNEQGGPQVARPRKLRRDRCKSNVQQQLEMVTADQGPCEVINAIQAEAQRSKYSRTLCQNLLDDWLSQNGDARTCLAGSTAARTAREPEQQDHSCRATLRFSV